MVKSPESSAIRGWIVYMCSIYIYYISSSAVVLQVYIKYIIYISIYILYIPYISSSAVVLQNIDY